MPAISDSFNAFQNEITALWCWPPDERYEGWTFASLDEPNGHFLFTADNDDLDIFVVFTTENGVWRVCRGDWFDKRASTLVAAASADNPSYHTPLEDFDF